MSRVRAHLTALRARRGALLVVGALGVFSLAGTVAALSAFTSNADNSVSIAGLCPTAVAVPAYVDLTIDQNSPNSQDASGALLVRSEDKHNKRALLRFAVPNTPGSCTLDRATLKLAVSGSSTAGRQLRVYAASSDVSASATWNSPPGRDVQDGPAFAVSPSSGAVRFDVTPQVSADTANHGLVIQDGNEGAGTATQVSLASMEDSGEANRPQLVLSYVPS